MMRLIAVAAVAVVSSFTAWAGTLYVDKEKGSDTAGNGSSESPYATIQKAVDKSEAGGTVLVRPGVYDTGDVTDGKVREGGMSGNQFLCRVYIDKNLTLESTTARPLRTSSAWRTRRPARPTRGWGRMRCAASASRRST